jgi:predicted small secreted protein
MLQKNKIMTVIFIALIGLSLTACETMGGAGRDIEHAGESVQDAAQ